MKEYIIKIQVKVDGKWKTGYHENILNQTVKWAVNMYVEDITIYKRKAKKFLDKKEAENIAKMFSDKFQTAKIITLPK